MAVAPVMLLNVILSVETCHCIVPVFPVKVIFAGEVPEQIVWFPLTVPATEVVFTVTVTTLEFTEGQTPLVTTAL